MKSMGSGRILMCALAAILLTIGPPAASAAKNILLVIADDYGADGQSLYNTNPAASLPPTPNINALAARGVRFTTAYSYPVCSPTRSAVITGRYGFRTGVTTVLDAGNAQGIYTNEFTLPELLASTHRCGSFGKWHLGGTAPSPNTVGGWPQFSGSLLGGLASFYSWNKVSNGVTRMNYPTYATTDNVNDALSWVNVQGTNRWFLWLAFNAPHTPYHLPPTNLCPHYAGLSGTATDIQQNPRKYFEAAVEAMDTELGRLLAGINQDDTTVFFMGDNGTMGRVIQPPFRSTRGKDTLYEGGVRVPMIAAGPDIIHPARTSDAVVHVVDLFATILELGGVNPTTAIPRSLPIDSRSLATILRDETFKPAQDAVLVENSDTLGGSTPGRAIRRGDYKLIQFTSNVEEFYYLAGDPLENTNLLIRALTTAEQSALDLLRTTLAAWSNQPNIYRQSRVGNTFSVEAGWFVDHQFSLWKAANLQGGNWVQVTNATEQNLGATVQLSDPLSPSGGAFYRVRNN